MVLDFRYFRPAFNNRSWSWLVAHVVVAGVLVASGATADASLVQPEALCFSLDECLAGATAGGSSGSSQALSEEAQDSRDSESERQLAMEALLPLGAPSGSSTSTSGSGPSGTSASALGSVATPLNFGPTIVGWVSGELRFALPTPLGNDLLRPPQGV